LKRAVENEGCDLVILSGGTGFTPDDVTPEAVLKVIEKRAESLVHYLQTEALKISPMTCLSRTVIGTVRKEHKQVMVITLPGKPKAIVENLTILLSKNVLKHALQQCNSRERH